MYEYLCRNALTELKKNVCMVIDQLTLNPVSFLAVSTELNHMINHVTQ